MGSRVAAELSAKWFKDREDRLRSLLKQPLDKDPAYWGVVIQNEVVPFFRKFHNDFADIVSLGPALKLVETRVESATHYLDAVVAKLAPFSRGLGHVDFSDPEETLRWMARTSILEKMSSQVKTVGDLFKQWWFVRDDVVDSVVSKTLAVATSSERLSITDSSRYREKFEFLSRVKFEAKVLRALVREKLDGFKPLEWVSRVRDQLVANYSDRAIEESGAFREFDLFGMKIIVADDSVDESDIKKYVGYLVEAHALLKAKKFASAWYGNVFINCNECGGRNENSGGSTGGWYEIGPDTIRIFSRPSRFIVELVVHELGHRYWFKTMSSTQRARFEALVKTHTKPRPNKPIVNRLTEDAMKRIKVPLVEADDVLHKLIVRTERYDLAHVPDKVRQNVVLDGREAVLSIIDAITNPDVPVVTDKQVLGLKGDAYNTRNQLLEVLENFTLVNDTNYRAWMIEALELKDRLVAEVYVYLDSVFSAYNDSVSTDPDMKEWQDSYDSNPAPVVPVSTYGKSNIDEAFAEVFAHYVLEYDMTRDQAESFRSVLSSVPAEDSAEAFVDGFFKRHSKLRKYAPKRVLDKSGTGAGTHGEARQHGDEIWLYPKFWALGRTVRDFVFAHELGHYVLGRKGISELTKVAQEMGVDLWDLDSLPFGQFNMEEAFADAFASYYLDPSDLKRYPKWESIVETIIKTGSSMVDRVAARFAATVVPFRPSGPTITIAGRKYAKSDYFPMLSDMEDMSGEGKARLIDMGPDSNKFRYLWAYDTDKQTLTMWRISDGEEKHYSSAKSSTSDIIALDRKKQLNRVNHAELRDIERFMRSQQDDALAAMKKYLEENADDWDRQAKAIAQELFDQDFYPKLIAKFKEIDAGITPLGFRLDKDRLDHRDAKEQAKMFVATKILNDYTVRAVETFARTKGIDPDNPPGDNQALQWGHGDVLDAFYEEFFR